MKTTEKEGSSAPSNTSRGGGGGRGRGFRGRSGGRGSGGRPTSHQGRGRGGGRAANNNNGGRGGNHGRHPRQQSKSSSTKQQSRQNQGGRGRGRPRSSSYNDRNDGTPKKTGPYAHLFCSERHAFALSRVFYPRNNDHFLLPSNHQGESGSSIHRIASDEQMENWWQAVKNVRCHVPYNETQSSLERCPICLDDEMVSPFIAPCGHSFCLHCVLGYLHSVSKELNDESDRIKKEKQQNVKVNAGLVGTCASSNKASVTSIRARCPMCSSGSSMALNAGDAMITYRDLRPVIFVPVSAVKATSAGGAQSGKGKLSKGKANFEPGTRMGFVKLHRAKQCPSPYLPVSGHRMRGAPTAASAEPQLPDLPDGDDDNDECTYSRQYFVGLDEYNNMLQRGLDDLINYRENTMYCKLDSREEFNVSMAIEAVQASQRRWLGSSGDDGGFRGMELEAKSAAVITNQLDQMLISESTNERNSNEDAKPAPRARKSRLFCSQARSICTRMRNQTRLMDK